jgi:hypothetical protein
MLNRALRLMNVDIIIKMGFFIDHHSANSFTVYRGQDMSKVDFEQMVKTKGGLISFNNFLSTSKRRFQIDNIFCFHYQC